MRFRVQAGVILAWARRLRVWCRLRFVCAESKELHCGGCDRACSVEIEEAARQVLVGMGRSTVYNHTSKTADMFPHM